MEDFVVRGNLYELYGGLLSGNQKKVYELHVIDDMSFTEIGEEMGTSRQAAQELFRRADEKLKRIEDTLGLETKFLKIRKLAEDICGSAEDPAIRKLAGDIIDGI